MTDPTDKVDLFAHAAANAKPDCPRCGGAGKYMYDHNHGTICNLCCRHDLGWWQLGEHHSKPGHWCCSAGCGHIIEHPPKEA
jgi:hypothetical protein